MPVKSADEFYSIMCVLTREMLEFGLMDANCLIKVNIWRSRQPSQPLRRVEASKAFIFSVMHNIFICLHFMSDHIEYRIIRADRITWKIHLQYYTMDPGGSKWLAIILQWRRSRRHRRGWKRWERIWRSLWLSESRHQTWYPYIVFVIFKTLHYGYHFLDELNVNTIFHVIFACWRDRGKCIFSDVKWIMRVERCLRKNRCSIWKFLVTKI